MADKFLYDLVPHIDVDAELEEGQVSGVSELDASTPGQRLLKLIKVNGLMSGRMGFGSPNIASRQEGIYDLYKIMCGWGLSYSVPLHMKGIVECLAPGSTPTAIEIDSAEYEVAYHYISSFADYFKRAPILPTAF
jgi:hypothetical protein